MIHLLLTTTSEKAPLCRWGHWGIVILRTCPSKEAGKGRSLKERARHAHCGGRLRNTQDLEVCIFWYSNSVLNSILSIFLESTFPWAKWCMYKDSHCSITCLGWKLKATEMHINGWLIPVNYHTGIQWRTCRLEKCELLGVPVCEEWDADEYCGMLSFIGVLGPHTDTQKFTVCLQKDTQEVVTSLGAGRDREPWSPERRVAFLLNLLYAFWILYHAQVPYIPIFQNIQK